MRATQASFIDALFSCLPRDGLTSGPVLNSREAFSFKACVKCNQTKSLHEYYSNHKGKDGHLNTCKECSKKYARNNQKRLAEVRKSYRKKNSEKIKNHNSKYKKDNKAKIRKYNSEYQKNNREKLTIQQREYRSIDADRRKAHARKYTEYRKRTDVNFKLSVRLRQRLYNAIKGNFKSGSAVRDLGCTIDELKQHLESHFMEGMTWDNWGINGWHIDHIRPLASFDLTDRYQLLAAVHYTNLQPLWAEENIRKGCSI